MKRVIITSIAVGCGVATGAWVIGFGPLLCAEAGLASGLIAFGVEAIGAILWP